MYTNAIKFIIRAISNDFFSNELKISAAASFAVSAEWCNVLYVLSIDSCSCTIKSINGS